MLVPAPPALSSSSPPKHKKGQPVIRTDRPSLLYPHRSRRFAPEADDARHRAESRANFDARPEHRIRLGADLRQCIVLGRIIAILGIGNMDVEPRRSAEAVDLVCRGSWICSEIRKQRGISRNCLRDLVHVAVRDLGEGGCADREQIVASNGYMLLIEFIHFSNSLMVTPDCGAHQGGTASTVRWSTFRGGTFRYPRPLSFEKRNAALRRGRRHQRAV